MSNHYYDKTPGTAHNRQTHDDKLRGQAMKFVTDAGVFSKAGVDYGSRVLIEAMELGERDHVLDVGCGYGPIGLSAARIAVNGHVTMIDINERAIELAKENARLNKIANVTIVQSDLFEAVRNERFDAIVSNPPIRAGKAVVHRIFEEGHDLLKEGGSMWIVIQKKQGAPSAFEKLESLFGEVEEVTKDKGYRIFRARKEILQSN
ncbi:class I SAM-dependent methyltransferase [Paenibacillus soyae]|uniref:Class I SAM-dependent methyltransferase n=1 Tax=Paenibacillus soyae TaxID=2969249 RepID=A0A9X2MVU9_9BACL|nr:class I SAM-dependent methyltransferase [Paenibacillus soyae]MCR2807287.1 class I SAM-dependent methyltransferase [Paenibacillus soyae]